MLYNNFKWQVFQKCFFFGQPYNYFMAAVNNLNYVHDLAKTGESNS